MRLNSIENSLFDVIRVQEDQALCWLEDLRITRDRLLASGFIVVELVLKLLVIREIGRDRRDGDRVHALRARKSPEEEEVSYVEAYRGTDADFCACEQSYPEGDHRGCEVHKGGLPVLVEDGGRGNDAKDCGDDNGCKCGFGDPE